MTGPPTPTNQEGPTRGPPSLPEGWLAQWEGQSRKYYYVQRATGHSQWDVPTTPALSVPTPDPTPQQQTDPFQQPASNKTVNMRPDGNAEVRNADGTVEEVVDRSLLGDLAINAITGGKHSNKPQSPLAGLASSFLGGQGSHGGQSSNGSSSQGGFGGIAGQLVGSLFEGGKPQNQQQQQQSSQQTGAHSGSSSGGQQGGLMGMASGFLGGHHGSSSQNEYGYTSSGHGSSSGGYTGQAPPASYKPPSQTNSGPYKPSGAQTIPAEQQQFQGASSGNPQSSYNSASVQHQVRPQSAYNSGNVQHQMRMQAYQGSNSGPQNYTASTQYGGSGQNNAGVPSYGQPMQGSHSSYGQQNQSSSGPAHGHHHHHGPEHQDQPHSGQPNDPNKPLPRPPQGGYSQDQSYPSAPNDQWSSMQHNFSQQNQSFPGQQPGAYGGSHPSTPAYGQQNQSYPPPPPPQSSSYGQQPPHSQTTQSQQHQPSQPSGYSQQPPPQNHQPPAYDHFPPPPVQQSNYSTPSNAQTSYPPPPQNTPAYSQQQGGYNPYQPAPPMGSHPSQQGSVPGPYPPRPSSSSGYTGQDYYGSPGGQGGQGGYGQQTAPPPPPPQQQSQGGYGQHPQQPPSQRPQDLPHGGYLQGGHTFGGAAPPAPGWKT